MGQDEDKHVLTVADLPTPYDPNVANLGTEDQFVEAAFELLNETTFTVLPLVGSLRDRPFRRDEAIRRALVQRLGLLGKSMLSNAEHENGYLQSAIGRQIIDAAATYLYLAEDEDGLRHAAYINHSLAEEKAALEIVVGQIDARDGDPLPIEKRMRRSIERMATAAGTTFDAVPGKAKSGWPRTEDRLLNVAPVAYLPFRTGSSFIHANWASLLQGDLEEADGGFTLALPVGPDVRPMTAAGILIADVAVDYLQGEGTEAERAWFLDRLAAAARKTRELDQAHEQFLQSAPED
jgi:hypothetical protein